MIYRCIQCHHRLGFRGDDDSVCGICGAIYPRIGEIEVFVSDPFHFLRSALKNLEENKKEVAARKAKLASAGGGGRSQEAFSLANDGYDGQLANLEVVERVMIPVKEYLSGRPRRQGLFNDFYLDESLWTSLNMLPYFYRDWDRLEEAQFLTRLFTDALNQFCENDRENVAILGCGACGLVHDLAEYFTTVCGVDFSIDTLLLAAELLAGAELDLHFNFPNDQIPISQRAVRLKGSGQKRNGVELIAANANNLPFASESVSCVISPYLLDIALGQSRIMSEIYRVLAPHGLWINFSMLSTRSSHLSVRSFDQLNNLDLPSFFRQAGFSLLISTMHRFKNIDLAALSEWAEAYLETPVFSVARKEMLQSGGRPDMFAEYFGRKSDSVWLLVPKISEYIALTQEKVFTDQGVEERQRIAVFHTGNSRPITNQNAILAGWLLRNINGTHTIKEILGRLHKEYGNVIREDDLIRLFSNLHRSELIEFPKM